MLFPVNKQLVFSFLFTTIYMQFGTLIVLQLSVRYCNNGSIIYNLDDLEKHKVPQSKRGKKEKCKEASQYYRPGKLFENDQSPSRTEISMVQKEDIIILTKNIIQVSQFKQLASLKTPASIWKLECSSVHHVLQTLELPCKIRLL